MQLAEEHQAEELLGLADVVGGLFGGKKVFLGTLGEFLERFTSCSLSALQGFIVFDGSAFVNFG